MDTFRVKTSVHRRRRQWQFCKNTTHSMSIPSYMTTRRPTSSVLQMHCQLDECQKIFRRREAIGGSRLQNGILLRGRLSTNQMAHLQKSKSAWQTHAYMMECHSASTSQKVTNVRAYLRAWPLYCRNEAMVI